MRCVSLCVCVCLGIHASLQLCVKRISIHVLWRLCVSAYFCMFVCGDICCTLLSLTYPTHTQVCPSVSDGSEWQEVKGGSTSVHVRVCGVVRDTGLFRCVICAYLCLSVRSSDS